MKKPEKILKKKNWAWISSFLNFPAKMSFQKALNFQKYLIKNWGKIWKKKPRQNIEFILGFKSNFFFQIFFEFVVLKDFFKGEKFGKNDPNFKSFYP